MSSSCTTNSCSWFSVCFPTLWKPLCMELTHSTMVLQLWFLKLYESALLASAMEMQLMALLSWGWQDNCWFTTWRSEWCSKTSKMTQINFKEDEIKDCSHWRQDSDRMAIHQPWSWPYLPHFVENQYGPFGCGGSADTPFSVTGNVLGVFAWTKWWSFGCDRISH